MPDFLLDSTKVHAWTDRSENGGRAGYGVYFPHAEYSHRCLGVIPPVCCQGGREPGMHKVRQLAGQHIPQGVQPMFFLILRGHSYALNNLDGSLELHICL